MPQTQTQTQTQTTPAQPVRAKAGKPATSENQARVDRAGAKLTASLRAALSDPKCVTALRDALPDHASALWERVEWEASSGGKPTETEGGGQQARGTVAVFGKDDTDSRRVRIAVKLTKGAPGPRLVAERMLQGLVKGLSAECGHEASEATAALKAAGNFAQGSMTDKLAKVAEKALGPKPLSGATARSRKQSERKRVEAVLLKVNGQDVVAEEEPILAAQLSAKVLKSFLGVVPREGESVADAADGKTITVQIQLRAVIGGSKSK